RNPICLASGLTIFFLLLVVAACLIVWKYQSTIRYTFQSWQRRSVKKEEYTETPQADPRPNSYVSTEQMTGQTPIYENLMTTSNKQPAKPRRGPEEDLYLQCDVPDDVIYSNDPACNLSLLPDTPEEDVYIVPDAL
uniref:Uncharacterized protein n=1 Tax=Labrus bergylta TaxID=56723 RepID=A0A3Q3FGD8_9LABR